MERDEPIFDCFCGEPRPPKWHYHCPECGVIKHSNTSMKNHLITHSKLEIAAPVAPVAPPVVAPKPTIDIDLTNSVGSQNDVVVDTIPIFEISDEKDVDYDNYVPEIRKRRFICTVESCQMTTEYRSQMTRHERTHTTDSINCNILKSAVVDATEQIYLVRSAVKGSDFKVHVNLRNETCRSRECIRSASNSEKLICRHVRSAQLSSSSVCEFHCITVDMVDASNLSQDKKHAVTELIMSAEEEQKPLIAEFSEDRRKIRNFSVYSSNSKRAYVRSFFNERNGQQCQAWTCDICSDISRSNCVHIYCAMIIDSLERVSPIQEDNSEYLAKIRLYSK